MSVSDNYWEKIPSWNSSSPQDSFEILSDGTSGRLPVTKIEHWREFTSLIESPFFNSDGVEYVYRGHRRYDWGMTPTLARVTENDIITEDISHKQLSMFRKAIRGRITDHTLFDESLEDDELWSIGQHHGLMTPLLDWTYSPYVSLFFAFSKEDQEEEDDNPYRVVFILNKSFIADDELCPDIRMFEPKKDDYGRLVNQAGLFTFSPYDSTIENKLTEVLTAEDFQDDELKNATEKEQPGIIAKYICKIYIKNEEQQECLKFLRRMNVHHASLFPDLIGAAEYCNVFMMEQKRIKTTPPSSEALYSYDSESTYSVAAEPTATYEKADSILELLKMPDESREVEPGRIELIANELSKVLSKSMLVDWQERETLQARIKTQTRVLLRKYGYPINARNKVIENIIDVLSRGAAE